MYFENQTEAQLATGNTEGYIREPGNAALDSTNFHYPTYGAMTRFLGLDGDIGFEGVDFAQHWNAYLLYLLYFIRIDTHTNLISIERTTSST